jgi:uncharacterized membrane protein
MVMSAVAVLLVALLVSSTWYVKLPVPHIPTLGVKRTHVPTILGVPRAPVVRPVMESSLGVLSESVSFERTETVTATLRRVPSISSVACGASLTHVTINDPVAVLLVAPLASSTW